MLFYYAEPQMNSTAVVYSSINHTDTQSVVTFLYSAFFAEETKILVILTTSKKISYRNKTRKTYIQTSIFRLHDEI